MNDYQENFQRNKLWDAFAWIMRTPCITEIDKMHETVIKLTSYTKESNGSNRDQAIST